MTETLFYHLERRSLDDVLPGLIERTRARGWKALIRTDTAERADAIDTLLWTYADDSFLPHARDGDGDAAAQPVLITVEEHLPNQPDCLFLTSGAQIAWDGAGLGGLSRIVLLFDGGDQQALALARAAWKAAKAAGHEVTYWKESASGKWEKQA